MTRNTDNYAGQTIAETLKVFESQADRGLSDTEAARRIGQYGYNEIEEKEEALKRLWGDNTPLLRGRKRGATGSELSLAGEGQAFVPFACFRRR